MNPHDLARLQLAYQAYHRVRPSEFEVNAGAQRVLAEMRSRRLRRHGLSKPWIALGVLLVGALAYAATEAHRFQSSSASETSASEVRGSAGVSETRTGQEPPSAVKPKQQQLAEAVLEKPTAPSTAPRPMRGEEPGPVSVQRPVQPTPRRAARAREFEGAPRARATWSEVARALDADDAAGAERALEGLLTNRAGGERAKARLGLSQLALGQGDCKSAMAHARRVLADASGRHFHPRARSIVTECRTHPLPPRPPFKD